MITQAPKVKEIIPFFEEKRDTVKYYDFNEEIVIKPPLDEEGNLLSGWRIQEEP